MTPTRNQGRLVGLFYLLASIPAFFALIYVPGKIIVHGNSAATLHNIVASETLFRIGIGCELVGQILFVGVALALYDLLKGVDRRRAALMFGLIAIALPIALLNELNAIAALMLAKGNDFLSIVEKPQRDALAMLFLQLHSRGFDLAALFWGLWLYPLGLLVYRSGFFPRILGILLMANCLSYLVDSLTSIVAPQYSTAISHWTTPLSFGELIFMVWLLILGTSARRTLPADTA